MQAYPKIKRLAVLAARDSGKTTREVAAKYNVSQSWVRRVVQERRELGKTAPYKYRRRNRHGGPLKQRVKFMVLENPRIRVEELERVLETPLSLRMLQAAKNELEFNNDVVWYGGVGSDLVRSPTGKVGSQMTRTVLPWDLECDLVVLSSEA